MGPGESSRCQEKGLGWGGTLFYKLKNSLQTVGPNRDLNRLVGISIADLMGKMVGMEGLMVQVFGGANSDPRGPMESEEWVVKR